MPETVNLTTSSLILALIGSGVVATLVGTLLEWLRSWYLSNRRRSDDRNINFYQPLEVLLLNIKNSQSYIKYSADAMAKMMDSKVQLDRIKGLPLSEIQDSINTVRENWKDFAADIFELINSKRSYIKDEDFNLSFKEFLSVYSHWKSYSERETGKYAPYEDIFFEDKININKQIDILITKFTN